MKQQIGMNSSTLGEIFAQIKAYNKEGKSSLQLKASMLEQNIYRAYRPIIASYSKKYNIPLDEVEITFDEVFSFVYNNMLNEVIEAEDFNPAIRNIMIKKCQAYNNDSQIKHSDPVIPAEEVAKQSYFYTLIMIAELNKNPNLAQELEISKATLKLLNDFYGINKEAVRYTPDDLAERYGISPVTVRSRIVISLKKIRNRHAFELTKKQNPDFNFGS